MTACELLLGPEEVSLARASVWADVERPESAVLGALLERQIGSLEASRWKPHVKALVARLLLDANDIYLADVHPVRRARVLLRSLEFKYHGGMDEEGDGYLGAMAEVVEVERLLSHDVSLVFMPWSDSLTTK